MKWSGRPFSVLLLVVCLGSCSEISFCELGKTGRVALWNAVFRSQNNVHSPTTRVDFIGNAAKRAAIPRWLLNETLALEWSPLFPLVSFNANGTADYGPAQINTSALEHFQEVYRLKDPLDYEQAVNAAARHLRWLYERTADWFLAAAAYNAGLGGMAQGRGLEYAARVCEGR